MSQFIRLMELQELGRFYEFIKRDFPPNEYPPYDVLEYHLREGIQKGLVFCNENGDAAYAICAEGHSNGFVLISQLAVFKEQRGKGVGSAFIRALHEKYSCSKGVIVEVEKPECAKTSEEEKKCKRRIAFYESLGFYKIPAVDFSIWGVPLHLMALPMSASEEFINQEIGIIIYEIYYSLIGKRYIHKMQFQRLQE